MRRAATVTACVLLLAGCSSAAPPTSPVVATTTAPAATVADYRAWVVATAKPAIDAISNDLPPMKAAVDEGSAVNMESSATTLGADCKGGLATPVPDVAGVDSFRSDWAATMNACLDLVGDIITGVNPVDMSKLNKVPADLDALGRFEGAAVADMLALLK